MTNGNGSRDDELELIRQLLITTARRAYSADERLDRLVQSQQITQNQLDRLEQRQDRTQQQLDQLSGSVDQLREDVEIAFQTITEFSNNTDRTIASINASIQRQDRILDYLMRRDRNANGDEP